MNVDRSPEAVTRRLKQVDELRRLCLALAGPRLKWDWRRTSADVRSVVKEEKANYKGRS
jgi:hypothetical protein